MHDDSKNDFTKEKGLIYPHLRINKLHRLTFTGLTHARLTFNSHVLLWNYYDVNAQKTKRIQQKIKEHETLEIYAVF